MKYKIKSYYNDLGNYKHTPFKRRWFGFYTSLSGVGGPNFGDIKKAEGAIKNHAFRCNKPKPETIYIDVTVNNDAIKLERTIVE